MPDQIQILSVSELRGLTSNVLACGHVRFFLYGEEVFFDRMEKSQPHKDVGGVAMPDGTPTLAVYLWDGVPEKTPQDQGGDLQPG
jgi:hypothetical protein